MVVRLDLEGHRVAAADVDRARVLARAHDDARPLGGQAAKELSRVLVGAVLRPEEREHRQLDVVRLAAQLLVDELELGVGQPELAMLGGSRCRFNTHGKRLYPRCWRLRSELADEKGQPTKGECGHGQLHHDVAAPAGRERRTTPSSTASPPKSAAGGGDNSIHVVVRCETSRGTHWWGRAQLRPM